MEEQTDKDIKIIFCNINLKNNKKKKYKQQTQISTPPQKKIITTTKIWNNILPEDLLFERQIILLNNTLQYYWDNNKNTEEYIPKVILKNNYYIIILQHIKQKLYSYRNQDIIKNKYDKDNFVNIIDIFNLLISCNMDCYYCKKKVMLLYEYIREPLQWSLDRIDNNYGHNKNNLFIACLSCNLKRRCIKPEKYVLTKKCSNIKRENYIEKENSIILV